MTIIDVRTRRADRLIGTAAVLAAAIVAGAWMPDQSVAAVVLVVSMIALAACGLWLHGWFGGPHRVSRIAWSADSQWQLWNARGQRMTATLRPDSRLGSGWLWLRWNAESAWPRCHSMLLVRGDIPEAQLRRLIVRLRLDAPVLFSSQSASTQSAPTPSPTLPGGGMTSA